VSAQLAISAGQCSDKGRKPLNQDFHAVMTPTGALLGAKGIALALADGVSSSAVSQEASEASVNGFLQDYYSTSESWSVKTSVQKVLHATNSWLYAQNRGGQYRYNIEKGYVCTFSAMVLKSTTAHIFHAGDSRVYRVNGNELEQLTEDHRVWLSPEKSYLGRALGMRDYLELDYQAHTIASNDTFVLATDGVYEFAKPEAITAAIGQHRNDLNRAAQQVVAHAIENGSDDNLTVQIVRIDQLPEHGIDELHQQATTLPLPPELRPRMSFDGYTIVRELHHSHRSHIYLARDEETGESLVLKVPSVDMRDNEAYLESFLMEEWVARRLNNAHLLKASPPGKPRNYLYSVSEYIEGQSLSQWMNDNPNPSLETVRSIIEQVAKGLQAMHRQEILHQDLRPNNIMLDSSGTAKIIDFGSVRVGGIAEISGIAQQQHILGTLQYTAPEYFIGEPGTTRSDLFSLAVITYQMLSGRQPYGTSVARATTPAAQRKLHYRSVLDPERAIPTWIDGALRKALNPNPARRHEALSEFVYDLRQPNPTFQREQQLPLMQRNPLLFWKGLSLTLFLVLLGLLGTHPFINGS
jgi:serine/threonine protein kinase/serine/threonine protein phosphatase PrpC